MGDIQENSMFKRFMYIFAIAACLFQVGQLPSSARADQRRRGDQAERVVRQVTRVFRDVAREAARPGRYQQPVESNYGGGCNAFGCYGGGGGCNAFGCWNYGGGCNPFG